MSANTESPTDKNTYKILWRPSLEQKQSSELFKFIEFCNTNYEQAIDSTEESAYRQLHQWSITKPEQFWEAIWTFYDVSGQYSGQTLSYDSSEQSHPFLSANWFPGTTLNFAENLLGPAINPGNGTENNIAIVERGEAGQRLEITYQELNILVTKLACYLKHQGLSKGDRVAAFLPNSHYAVVGMLASASLGAIWSSCSPDFGLQGVLDRFSQIKPKVLIACNGYQYAGKQINTLDRVSEIASNIESLETLIIAPYNASFETASWLTEVNKKHDFGISWENAIAFGQTKGEALSFEQVSFTDPLYILYSSGTTGKPKCIVHSVGGTLLQHLKELSLHSNVSNNTKLFYYTTCGWMMWNWLVSGLGLGATLILYDGSPFHPEQSILFDIAEQEAIEVFGASAKFYAACQKYGLKPRETHNLDALKTLLSTGSPLAHESFDYLYEGVKRDVCVSSISGGTDIVSCFALGNPIQPVFRGTLQCAGLGMDLAFYSEEGAELKAGRGELVCQSPFPSAPIGFWNDDGEKFFKAYFSRFNNVWAHGDYGEFVSFSDSGSEAHFRPVVIHGRSDAVLNPGGVRIGTAELYRQVEKVDQVFEALAIGQSWEGDVRIVLFVRLQDGLKLDDELRQVIKTTIRANTTPRHVPAKIIQVDDLPRTLSGKIVELAVRKVVHDEEVNNKDALANPEALDQFIDIEELKHA